MGNTCTLQKTFRFKNLVLAVYPDNPNDGPVKSALDQLENYVASNPERIPRVCRKISKLMAVHLRYGKIHRVLVGALMLRHLIAQSNDVSGFVPHSIDICAALLSQRPAECRTAAADVLSALFRKLSGRPDGEQSRRLLAGNKERLLPGLEAMCADPEDGAVGAVGEEVRFAALVAIGNAAHCLRGALCDVAERLLLHALRCLAAALSLNAAQSSAFATPSAWRRAARWAAPCDAHCVGPFPIEKEAREAAAIGASAFAVAAVAGCVPEAAAQSFLQCVQAFIARRGAWSLPVLPCIAFWLVARGMEGRPQRLGFAVCQCLCRAAEEAPDAAVRTGAVRALTRCAGEVRMTGGRPQVLLDIARHAMAAVGPHTEGTVQAVLDLFRTLARTTHRWRNASQLYRVLAELLEQLKRAERENATTTVLLTLRVLTHTVPYVRTFPIMQRDGMNVLDAIGLYLRRHDELQVWAARVLVGLLAGSPPATVPIQETDDEICEITDEGEEKNEDVLATDEQDIVSAKHWVFATLADKMGVTPCCVIEVGRVVTAVMQSHGVRALPFVITVIARLQAAVEHPTATTGKSAKSKAKSTAKAADVVTTKRNGVLQVAWAHLSLVVLANCGVVYGMPGLTKYAMDILQERQLGNPCELAQQFCSTLQTEPSGIMALRLASNCNGHAPMSGDQESVPVVTSLILIDKLIDAVVEIAAASPEICQTFGIAPEGDLRRAIADISLSPGVALDEDNGEDNGEDGARSPTLRARPGLPQPFSLTPAKPRENSKTPGMKVIFIVDAGNGEPVGDRAEVRSRVDDILARYGVSPMTELLGPTKLTPPLPLPKLLSVSLLSPTNVPEPVSNYSLLRNKASTNLYQSFCADDVRFHADGFMSMATTNDIKLRIRADNDLQYVDPNGHVSPKKLDRVPWGDVSPSRKYMDIL